MLSPIPLASGRPAATSFALCRRQNLPSGEVLGKKAISAVREWPRRNSRAWGSRVQPWSGGRSVRVRACYWSEPIAESGCPRGGRAGQPSKLPSIEKLRRRFAQRRRGSGGAGPVQKALSAMREWQAFPRRFSSQFLSFRDDDRLGIPLLSCNREASLPSGAKLRHLFPFRSCPAMSMAASVHRI